MTGSIYLWSTTAADNGTADPDINMAVGRAPSTVGGADREVMARIAEFIADIGGALVVGGSANALTVTANSAFTAYQNGLVLKLRIAADNSGAATLDANSIGAKSIRKMLSTGESALTGAEMQADGICDFLYSSAVNSGAGGWLLLNPAMPVASATLPGAVELATDAEAIAKADTARAVTPGNLAALGSSTTLAGLVELATDAEAQTGTDTARAITPANLQAVTATETRKGVVELSTDTEAQTGTDTARAITPANLQAVTATETRKGVVELATTTEASTGTDTARAVTPAGLKAGIPALTAGFSVGAVGTYAFLKTVPSVASDPGDTVAGSNLRYAGAGGANGTAPSGSWQCMGKLNGPNAADYVTLWLRVS